MRQLALLLLLCVAGLPLMAQSDSAVEPDEPDPHLNWIGRLVNIHADHVSQPADLDNSIKLEVIVTTAGRVEYAHAVEGPREYFSEAEAIEMDRRFKPFHKDSKPVKALIIDYVTILPPEKMGTKEPFPVVKDWNSLRFTLHRPTWYCEGCPAYRLEIRGDGTVIFESENPAFSDEFEKRVGNQIIRGKYRGKISRQQVEQVLEKFREADYFSLKDKYAMPATDLEEITTSLTIDGKTKKVLDYGGLEVGMPEAVENLEIAMDGAAVAAFRSQGLNEQADKLAANIARRH